MKQRLHNGKFATQQQILDDKLRPTLHFFIGMILTTTFAWSIQQGADIARANEGVVANNEMLGGYSQTTTATPSPTVTPVSELFTNTPEELKLFTEQKSQGSLESEKEQIIKYIVEVFGEHAPEAFNVLFCENRNLNPHATNHNRNGTIDRGIFQLNSAYWGGEENFDWKTNIDKAYMIFERANKTWKPWTCSHRIGQKNYLGQ